MVGNISKYQIMNPYNVIYIFTLLLIWTITKWFYKPTQNKKIPPSPVRLPILGNLHQLGSLPHQNLQSLARKYGSLMLLHFGKVPTLIVSSADIAREIMKTNDLIFSNRPDSSVTRRLLYNHKDISVAPYGEYWRQLKCFCVLQLLSNKRVQSFHSIREAETALMVETIRSIGLRPVNLSEMFSRITNDVVCRSALGKKYSEGVFGKKILDLLQELMDLLGSISIGEFIPCLSWINRINGFDARIDRVAKEVDDFLEGELKERMEIDPSERNGENFVDILLDVYLNNTTGVSIDRDSIKAIILDVFAAGTDTSSTVMEWVMAELIRHPQVMRKLQDEVRGIVKDKERITDNDLEKMCYLKAVMKETLRCHTPIPLLIPRVATKDVKVSGYDIASGTMVMINAWAIGRDPGSWSEPEKFKPERFLNSLIDYKGLNFELIPFGAGRRGCPGIGFAMATNEYVIANLVKEFDWGLPDGAEGKDLDMTERPGLTAQRNVPLLANASPHY